VSSEGDEFRLPLEQAMRMQVIKNMLDGMTLCFFLLIVCTDVGEDQLSSSIPLPNAHTDSLRRAIAYLQHYVVDPPARDDKQTDAFSAWDTEFLKMSQSELFELILVSVLLSDSVQAANYLDIKPLLDLCCRAVSNMMRGRTPEELRKTFNIKNDFTPEEEAQVRKENEWCE